MSSILASQPWKSNNSGRRYTGHVAVGADAEVNGIGQINSLLQDIFGGGTYSTVIGSQETMTGSPPIYSNGLSIKLASNYSSTPTSVIGIEALGATLAGNTAGASILAGFFGGSIHRGTGTVAQAYGVPGIAQLSSGGTITHAAGLYATVTNNSSGTITNAYGLNVATSTNSGGGTITTNYGLLLGAQSAGSTNYNLYSAGSTADNYYEGYVRTSSTGGFYMNALGSINNRFVINTPNTADATAECIIYPSSTARKPLVLQARAAQTADILEMQDSAGNMLAQVGATGKISVGNAALGSDGLDVFTAGSSAVAIFQGNGMINGSVLVGYTVGNAVTGSVYAYKASGSTTDSLLSTVQQNGAGNAVHEALVLGAGDAFSLYNINGGTAWSVGLDNSDSDSFKISGAGVPGTSDYLKITTTGVVSIAAGGSTTMGKVAGTVFDNYADAGNTGTGEDDLHTNTLAASMLNADGQKIVATYAGIFVGAATATQELRAYFGGTKIYDSGALAIGVATNNWTMNVIVIRESSTVVRCSVSLSTDFGTLFPYSTYTRITGLTLTNTQIIKITGEAAGVGAADNQIIAKLSSGDWKQAA